MLKTVCQRFGFAIQAPFPKVNHEPTAYQGTPYEQIVKDRKTYMPNFYSHNYKQPLLIHQGHKQYLYDHTGKRYIDLIAGICTVSVGHSHPSINQIIADQTAKLSHTSPIYAGEWQGEYSKRLCQELGDGFDSVYLCNSGGEANDFAVYLARLFTKEYKFFSHKNGYHGMAGLAGNLTNVGTWNSPMRGGFEFERLAWPSAYRGSIQTREGHLRDAQETIGSASNGKVAGYIFEPIQGAGGLSPIPDFYPLTEIVDIIRNKHGGLIIADEVQTGLGRVGTKYWGHRWKGVKPDIVTMAKGIGNGFPMGAVVTRKEITDRVKHVYFNTFGGGHLQCRIGIEVLDIIKRDKLPENAEKVGGYLIEELKKLQKKHQILGDVRGKGLMIGLQIVKDKESKQPAAQETAQLMELTRERGLLMGKGGAFGNVLRIQPPLCLNMEDAKYIVDALDDAFHQMK